MKGSKLCADPILIGLRIGRKLVQHFSQYHVELRVWGAFRKDIVIPPLAPSACCTNKTLTGV